MSEHVSEGNKFASITQRSGSPWDQNVRFWAPLDRSFYGDDDTPPLGRRACSDQKGCWLARDPPLFPPPVGSVLRHDHRQGEGGSPDGKLLEAGAPLAAGLEPLEGGASGKPCFGVSGKPAYSPEGRRHAGIDGKIEAAQALPTGGAPQCKAAVLTSNNRFPPRNTNVGNLSMPAMRRPRAFLTDPGGRVQLPG